MKRWTRLALSILIGLAIVVVAAVVTVRILVQPATTDFIGFADLHRSPTPNDALACPPGSCESRFDLTVASPPISAESLAAKVKQLPALEPRTTIVNANEAEHRYVLVQRSALFDFPDTINIAIEPVDASHATLAIYSRSGYGK